MPAPHVGQPLKRVEDPKLVTGRDPYVNDVRVANALAMVVVRSPFAHAVITRIDASAARAVPGVVAVFSGRDLNDELGVLQSPLPDALFDTIHRQGRPLPAADRVRHVGEPVAVVLAEDVRAATDAAEAVVVDYDPLPAVVDAQAALERGAPLLYPEQGTNLCIAVRRERGDVDGAFRDAPVVLDVEMYNQRLIPLAMEPRACTAVWDARAGKLTIWGDTQVPHRMRDQIAAALRLPPEQVHLMTGRVGRPDRIRQRPHPHAVAADGARRQRHRRVGDDRLDARGRQRGDGRPRAPRRRAPRPAAHTGPGVGGDAAAE